ELGGNRGLRLRRRRAGRDRHRKQEGGERRTQCAAADARSKCTESHGVSPLSRRWFGSSPQANETRQGGVPRIGNVSVLPPHGKFREITTVRGQGRALRRSPMGSSRGGMFRPASNVDKQQLRVS